MRNFARWKTGSATMPIIPPSLRHREHDRAKRKTGPASSSAENSSGIEDRLDHLALFHELGCIVQLTYNTQNPSARMLRAAGQRVFGLRPRRAGEMNGWASWRSLPRRRQDRGRHQGLKQRVAYCTAAQASRRIRATRATSSADRGLHRRHHVWRS
jgi:hypothetical protein